MTLRRTSITLAIAGALALAAGGVHAQSLRGSPSSIDRMYGQARSQDLTFYRSGASVRAAARSGDLVRLSGNSDYRLADVTYPYALSSTRTFVQRLSAQYRRACGERLVITSATRPTSLRLLNSSDRSVHPAGMAIDIRKPTRQRCLTWLRETLLVLEARGVLEATEENRPPHFHVAVYPRQYLAYVGKRPGGRVAQSASAKDERVTYRVRRGDSLWAIARRHNTSVERLKEANEMSGSRLIAGQVLVIPATR